MSLEGQVLSAVITPWESFWLVVKIVTTLLAIIYFFFSLIVVRQVNLMTDTLVTEVSPLLRALAILHAGLSLGIIMILIGLLFA